MLAFKEYRKKTLVSVLINITIGLGLVVTGAVSGIVILLLNIDHVWLFVSKVVAGAGLLFLAFGITDYLKMVKSLKIVENAEFEVAQQKYIEELRKVAGELIKRIVKKNPGYDQADKLLLLVYFGIKMAISIKVINLTLYGLDTKLRIEHYPNFGFSDNRNKLQGKIVLYFPSNDNPNVTRTKDFLY